MTFVNFYLLSLLMPLPPEVSSPLSVQSRCLEFSDFSLPEAAL